MTGGKKLLTTIASIVLAALLMYHLLSKAGLDTIAASLGLLDYRWILPAVGLYTFDMLIRAFRWKAVLKGNDIRISIWDSFLAYNLGNSLNIVIPAKIGDVARSYYLKKKHGLAYSRTLPATFLDRVFDVLGVYAVLFFCGIYIMTGTRLEPWLYYTFAAGMAALVVILILMELLLKRKEIIERINNAKLRSLLYSLLEAFSGSFRERGSFMLLLACSVAIWLCEGVFSYLVFLSMGQGMNPVVVIFATMIAVLTKVVPVTPGGIGVFEGTMVLILSLFGMDPGTGAVVSTINHFIMNLYTILLGLYALLSENISIDAIRRERVDKR
ncbi:MAG TPA: lysylphosphatidylglycerol synthase transmembrane domain-containing protein [Clostridia bacterium]|nr:lysylphosphatidylglycerol synthase transmembrane domain-containing protein [Clostridia bacterium]